MDDNANGPATSSAPAHQAPQPEISTSLQSALRLWLDLIGQTGGWRIGHAWLTGADQRLHSSRVWSPGADATADPGLADFAQVTHAHHYGPGEGLPGQVLANGQPVLLDTLPESAGFQRAAAARAAGLRAAYLFPLHTAEGVTAVLEFFAPQPQPPSASLLATLSGLGSHLALLLHSDALALDLPRQQADTRQILDGAGEAFVGMDAADRITEWNHKAEAVFGWRREEVLGRTVTETIVPPSWRHDHQHGVARFLRTETPHVLGQRLEMEALHRDGHTFPIAITQWALRGRDGWSFYAFITDITERKRVQRELEWMAYYDHLTGLPNRSRLLHQLDDWLRADTERRRRTTVYFVDLDHFKSINESFGYATGNKALLTVARRLCSVVNAEDLVARVNADEFILVTDQADVSGADQLAERLLTEVASPLTLNTDRTFLTASIGYARADQDATAESLLRCADIALSHAKRLGRGQYVRYRSDMQSSARHRMELEKELAEALGANQLRLYYQPIVDSRTETLMAMEALLRWQHPRRGLVSPAEFIPIAEETGLIVPIGTWVMREAHRQLAHWEQTGLISRSLYLSVNLSARQLAQSDLISTVRDALALGAATLQHAHLGMEVTESVMMRNPADATRNLQALRALGLHLSIDDFGTGYSSLAYLKQFPFHVLKIDISFVRNIVQDARDRAIVRSITQLAKALGLTVVAEGVETRAQRDALREADVDLLQGYLYSRPVPAEQMEVMLGANAALARD